MGLIAMCCYSIKPGNGTFLLFFAKLTPTMTVPCFDPDWSRGVTNKKCPGMPSTGSCNVFLAERF